MKRLITLLLAVILLAVMGVAPITAQEATAVNPFPTAAATQTEPQATPEVTPVPDNSTDTQTEIVNETSRVVVIGAIALGTVALLVLSSVLAFAVVALGKSVPAPLAQPYYGAVYSGERVLESNVLNKLEQRAATTPETWDDEFAAIARRVFNEQYQKVQTDAAARGVVLPDIS